MPDRKGDREGEREKENKRCMGREVGVKISLFFHLSVGKHVEPEPCPSVGSTGYCLSQRNTQNPAAKEV